MPIKIISIVILAILTLASQASVLAGSKYSSDLFNHSQSMFCAEATEATDDENKETQEEEEEEPDCD